MELSFNRRRTRKIKNQPIGFTKILFEQDNTLDGYDLLAIAIVNQAAEDYRLARDPNEILALERFFLSDWGDLLSFDKGAYILERLQKEVNM